MLNILNRKGVVSGTELMDEIENYTDLRPSHESIYPLLTKCEKQGLIELVKSDYLAYKRCALTKRGVRLIEKFRQQESNIKSRYLSIQKSYWKLLKGMQENLFEDYSSLLKAIEKNNTESTERIQNLSLEASNGTNKIVRQLEKKR